MAHFLQKILGQPPSPEATPPPIHPYSPSNAAVPGYIPNARKDVDLILAFASALTPILGTAWFVATWYNRRLSRQDQIKILWFMLCGTLHTFFEGYFVANHDRVGARQDLFAELWKEYSLSDSRYLTSNTFVLAAEGVTVAVLGPLSYLLVYLVATGSPYKTPVQVICSFGHLYSDTLYYVTSLIDFYIKGIDHCRPEPFYFWVYYVGMNAAWIVVPLALVVQGVRDTSRAFAALDRMARSLQTTGTSGKAVGN